MFVYRQNGSTPLQAAQSAGKESIVKMIEAGCSTKSGKNARPLISGNLQPSHDIHNSRKLRATHSLPVMSEQTKKALGGSKSMYASQEDADDNSRPAVAPTRSSRHLR
jgi:hypothetical protein